MNELQLRTRSGRVSRFNLRDDTRVDSVPWFAGNASSTLLIATPGYSSTDTIRNALVDHQNVCNVYVRALIYFASIRYL